MRGTLESRKEGSTTSISILCFTSPFDSFEDFSSQNEFNNSSKAGVFSSSIDSTLGRLNGLFVGVEHDGSSTYFEI